MVKYIHSLWLKVIVAIVSGFLLAGAGTTISHTCMPKTPDGGCVVFEKAVMHPVDLLNNKQDSLLHFSATFVVCLAG